MKGTSIFQFKAWPTSWPKIHHPLPRTPRESKQLLNALTSSFRRQLDSAYPAAHTPGRETGQAPANIDSSAHATDRHLHNILDNPLFRVVPPKGASIDRLPVRGKDEQSRVAEEPMKVFDERAAAGTVTVPLLVDCLMFQLRRITTSSETSTAEAMKSSRMASRVVEWFWASDGASRQGLLRSKPALQSLAKFMVAEGSQNTIIDWLRLILSRDIGGQNGRMTEATAQQAFKYTLQGLVEAELRYGGGFGSALKSYLRVCHMCATSPYQPSLASAQPLLATTAVVLNRALMNENPSKDQVSTYTYDEYTEVLSTLTTTRSLLYAGAAFYNPHAPNPQPLVQFAEHLTPTDFARFSKARTEVFLRITCDVLQHLIDRDNIQEATTLAKNMQQLRPDLTGPSSTAERRPVTRERRAEQDLLNRLEIGLA